MRLVHTVRRLLICVLLLPAALQAQLATGTVDFTVEDLHDREQVTITLSDASSLVLLKDYVVDDEPGKYTWIGFVQDDVNGRAYITVSAPNAVGNIQTSAKLYELAITEAATNPVQEIDPLTLPPEADDLPDFFGPLRHWKMASGCAALPHDLLNAAGVC